MTITRPTATCSGRFRMLIQTPSGWTAGRNTYRRLRIARKAARWYATLSEVRLVRIVDEVECRIVCEFNNPRRKPR